MTGGDFSALTPVLPGAVPEQWGLDVRDSVILRFASEAARDSALTGLGATDSGLAAWLQDVKRLTIWDGVSWVPVGPHRVGGSVRTSDVSMTTTETLADSATVTVVAGRRYEILWSGACYSTTAGDSFEIRLRYAAGGTVANTDTLIKTLPMAEPAANTDLNGSFSFECTGIDPGETTFGVFAIRVYGSGTIHMHSSAAYNVHFFIKDIGV